jgi:hypothetical protein
MSDCLDGRAAGDHLPRNFAAPKVYTERRCAAIAGIHVMKSSKMICWKNTDFHAFTTTGKLRQLNPMRT